MESREDRVAIKREQTEPIGLLPSAAAAADNSIRPDRLRGATFVQNNHRDVSPETIEAIVRALNHNRSGDEKREHVLCLLCHQPVVLDDDGECADGDYNMCSVHCGRYVTHDKCARARARANDFSGSSTYTCPHCKKSVVIKSEELKKQEAADQAELASSNADKLVTNVKTALYYVTLGFVPWWIESSAIAFAKFVRRSIIFWWRVAKYTLWFALLCFVMGYPHKLFIYGYDAALYSTGSIRCIEVYNSTSDQVERMCRNYTATGGFPSLTSYQFECDERCGEGGGTRCPKVKSDFVMKMMRFSNGLVPDTCHFMLGAQVAVAVVGIAALLVACYGIYRAIRFAVGWIIAKLFTRAVIEGGYSSAKKRARLVKIAQKK